MHTLEIINLDEVYNRSVRIKFQTDEQRHTALIGLQVTGIVTQIDEHLIQNLICAYVRNSQPID